MTYFRFDTGDGLFNFYFRGTMFGPSLHLFHPWTWKINIEMSYVQLGIITFFWR
ncbi:MAG: hypothetical protein KAJ73_02300 [Zetaproteobacteria bacterium]|nr:hypothetical protein [Zetaproteobacteria bacterium]